MTCVLAQANRLIPGCHSGLGKQRVTHQDQTILRANFIASAGA